MKKQTALAFFLCLTVGLFAQKKNSAFKIHIRRTNLPIIIDGKGNEEAWQTTATAKSFYSVLPMDTGLAKVPTEVRMCFDEQYLNMRLQWRYKPASDLFLVYSNNYYATPFTTKNNAFILKFTYWWNK